MAATVSIKQYLNLGAANGRIVQVTMDASYPTGGYAITKTQLGLGSTIYFVMPANAMDSTGARLYEAVWDYANSKLKLFYPQGGGGTFTNDGSGTGSIPAGATTVTSTAAQPTVGINTAPGREVQNGANLTGVTCQMLVIGV